MILDRLMALLRLSEELLTNVLATNQATRSDAATATTTPRTESTGPNRPAVHPGEGQVAHNPPDDPAARRHSQHAGECHRGALRLGVDPVHGHRGQ